MTNYVTFLGSLTLALTLGTVASAQDDVTADTVIATVGDTEITLGEMIITRAQLPEQYQALPPEVLFTGVLDQLIQQQLLADVVEGVPPRVAMALKNEERTLLAGETINDITVSATTDEEVQAAYDARYENAEAETEYNASHLLVETQEEAVAAKERIDGGEDFAEVAKEVSTGPSGPNGGNLGWFGAGQMVTEFEEAVMGMEIDEVTGPIETQFGFHVIKLNETRIKEAPTLEQVRSQLQSELQETAIQERLAELTANTDVTRPEEGAFDPELLNNLDLLER